MKKGHRGKVISFRRYMYYESLKFIGSEFLETMMNVEREISILAYR